ncbi:MAG: oxidoreductase [Bifidobacteriaceae bacterium]|jgi:hypothetical protein|nr:oxidoreductase [Bifidobacteriaceae bacterium]
MGLFSRRSKRPPSDTPEGSAREARRATTQHLSQFVATRTGVEAYIEPPNSQTQTTILLIATTGEWTRRKVPDAKAARQLAAELNIPVYDVNFTGYPQRFRDWNSAQARRQPNR